MGVTVNDVKMLISQFADDTILFLSYDKLVLDAVFTELEYIEANTGLKILYEKTTLYRVGTARDAIARLYTGKPVTWSDGDISLLGVTIKNREIQDSTCYENIMDKMKSICGLWVYRKLTLTGKILLINSLLSSLLVYQMMVFPGPNPKQLKEMDDLILKFLWGDKKPKIPLKQLQCSREEGGLGLAHFGHKYTAIQCRWIKQLAVNSELSYVYTWLIPEIKHLIWVTNLDAPDIQKMLKESYWKNVLLEWSKVRYTPAKSVVRDSVYDEMLWYNSNIRIGNQPVWYKHWYQAGIIYIQHILDEDGVMYSYENLRALYGPVIQWFEYCKLKTAIPTHWRNINVLVYYNQDDIVQLRYHDVINALKPTKIVYATCIKKLAGRLMLYWESMLRSFPGLLYNNYRLGFQRLKVIANSTKLRDFQYRLLLGKTFGNNILYKWGAVPSPYCPWCPECVQNIKHMIWDCEVSQTIWTWLKEWGDDVGAQLELSEISVLLSMLTLPIKSIWNFLSVVIKQYLYRCKCQGIKPTVPMIESEIELQERIYRTMAARQDKSDAHIKRWQDCFPEMGACEMTEDRPEACG